jgi:type II secretory pathway pseudopilin PulG
MRKKRAITLLEIMIVILLIGLIGGVVSYNLKGTLEKGKAFASEEGARKLEDILNLEIQQGTRTAQEIAGDKSKERDLVKECVLNSGLISSQQINKFIKDGWGDFFTIRKVAKENQVVVSSHKLAEYHKAHPKKDADEKAHVETEE